MAPQLSPETIELLERAERVCAESRELQAEVRGGVQRAFDRLRLLRHQMDRGSLWPQLHHVSGGSPARSA